MFVVHLGAGGGRSTHFQQANEKNNNSKKRRHVHANKQTNSHTKKIGDIACVTWYNLPIFQLHLCDQFTDITKFDQHSTWIFRRHYRKIHKQTHTEFVTIGNRMISFGLLDNSSTSFSMANLSQTACSFYACTLSPLSLFFPLFSCLLTVNSVILHWKCLSFDILSLKNLGDDRRAPRRRRNKINTANSLSERCCVVSAGGFNLKYVMMWRHTHHQNGCRIELMLKLLEYI